MTNPSLNWELLYRRSVDENKGSTWIKITLESNSSIWSQSLFGITQSQESLMIWNQMFYQCLLWKALFSSFAQEHNSLMIMDHQECYDVREAYNNKTNICNVFLYKCKRNNILGFEMLCFKEHRNRSRCWYNVIEWCHVQIRVIVDMVLPMEIDIFFPSVSVHFGANQRN